MSVEPLPPLELKGKAEPLSAYRLLSVEGDQPTRRLGVAMVGRERQFQLLRGAFENVASDRSCQLFTVLGPAGVGKSRLVAEFLQTLEGATVVRGRCLSYGEGITYWPVVEVVKQLGDYAPLVDEVIRHALDGLLGQADAAATPDQIAWAFRKLLEAHTAEQPVVCLFDDIQWGEETFLDLVEHVADLSRGVPILLLCMARPELLDRRPTWGGGMLNATNVLLEPLSEPETDELIARLVEGSDADAQLQARIRRAAGGNPLFVEEMVELVGHSADGDVVGPADDPGAAGCTPRPARPVRARSARARLGRGRALPSRRRGGPRRGRCASRFTPDRARSQGPRPSGTRAAGGGGRVPLPPPADP